MYTVMSHRHCQSPELPTPPARPPPLPAAPGRPSAGSLPWRLGRGRRLAAPPRPTCHPPWLQLSRVSFLRPGETLRGRRLPWPCCPPAAPPSAPGRAVPARCQPPTPRGARAGATPHSHPVSPLGEPRALRRAAPPRGPSPGPCRRPSSFQNQAAGRRASSAPRRPVQPRPAARSLRSRRSRPGGVPARGFAARPSGVSLPSPGRPAGPPGGHPPPTGR